MEPAPGPFRPHFSITPKIASDLMRIEAARQAVADLPISASVLATLRETARLYSTHYSTTIEGNRLDPEQVSQVIAKNQHIPGRERDEREVLGYYAALQKLEEFVRVGITITEAVIRTLHSLVMAGGRRTVKATKYRDGQNVIRDAVTSRIVYMPPEAKDVPILMAALIGWLAEAESSSIPAPLRAAIAHYQFATIHPFYDGNGRTARLLTSLILHSAGYGLKGLYSLEEYYARSLGEYYEALTIGPSHNYYAGRATADITKWIDYFCAGMADSFEKVRRRAQELASTGAPDQSQALRHLDPRQRRVLDLFREQEWITGHDVQRCFGLSERTARHLLQGWVSAGFLLVADPSKKARKYGLSETVASLLR